MVRATGLAAMVMVVAACGDDGGGSGDASSTAAGSEAGPATGGPSTSAPGTASSGTAAGGSSSTGDPGSSEDSSSGSGGQAQCRVELGVAWNDGTNCAAEDAIQVFQFDADTYILRQSLCTNFEGPFMYLLFGEDRVLLEDTGTGAVAIGTTVYGIIDEWLAATGKDSIELVVANSHAHGDHVAGNSQFVGQPNTEVIGASVAANSAYFGITTWPDEIVEFDLGGRIVTVIPIPGHETAHIALYDDHTRWLLTGDTLYSGRLYIANFSAYVASIGRMVDAVADKEVCQVMGTHVEMTNTPGVDFMFGSSMHPDEHPLELDLDHLLELRAAVEAMGNMPVYEVHDEFIIAP